MISAEELRDILHYDQETGSFTWLRPPPKMQRLIGARAGRVSLALGYRTIKIDGEEYYEHRLAFLYMTGSFAARVDHVDGNKADNKWANLRPCSHSLNSRNTRRAKASNLTTGLTGVHLRKRDGKFIAQMRGRGKRHIGVFDTAEDGRAAYVAERERLFPGGRWAQ